jgi:hypothetical protein
MESFVLLLKNEKLRSHKRIGYWVTAMNFVFFVFFAFFVKQGYEKFLWILLSMLIPILYYTATTISKKNISITYCMLIMMWLTISVWLAFIHIVLLILDILANRKLKIIFYTNGVEYPSFPKKTIQWNELDNVILKDGLITIDFKNNHLVQSEINTSTNEIDETAFNRFSQQQLKKSIIET